MSATKTIRPLSPTLAQALPLAQRYAKGESLAALAREWGCWRHDLRRRLETLGVLRPADTLPRRCRICAAPVRSGTSRDLCAAHVRSFCSRCERRLPAGRVNRWCALCEQERKPADYTLRRAVALRRPGVCTACGVDLPPGRITARCTDCFSTARKAQADRPGRRCAGCREPIPPGCLTYCNGCAGVERRWRYRWHQGDLEARALRPLRKYRRWQRTAAVLEQTP